MRRQDRIKSLGLFASALFFICFFVQRSDGALTLTTRNNVGDKCTFRENSEAVLTCQITPYSVDMTWKYDSNIVAQCIGPLCQPEMNAPKNFSFQFNTTAGIFIMTVKPVTQTYHGKIFACTEGVNSVSCTFTLAEEETESNTCDDLCWLILPCGVILALIVVWIVWILGLLPDMFYCASFVLLLGCFCRKKKDVRKFAADEVGSTWVYIPLLPANTNICKRIVTKRTKTLYEEETNLGLIQNLKPGKNYLFWLTEGNCRSPKAYCKFKTLSDGTEKAIDIQSTQVVLPLPRQVDYRIFICENEKEGWKNIQYEINDGKAVISNLTPNVTYQFRRKEVDTVGKLVSIATFVVTTPHA